MKRALVTGASGFTGRYVVDALTRRGFRVFGIGVGEQNAPDRMECDLTDAVEARRTVNEVQPDVVVHLAALAFVAESDQEDFYRVNVFGTLNLLEALYAGGKKPARVVIASSANVYGNTSGKELSEDDCPAPVNNYACSKLAMECMARTWFDRLPIVITRPFNYTGPGQDEKFVVPKIVGHYRRGDRVIRLGDTGVERDFSDVGDVVEAYMRLLEADVQGEVVNICSGRTISVAAILTEMERLAGYKIQVEVQADLVRRNEIQRLVGSNRKLRDLTGYVPDTPMTETLRRMYVA